MNRRPQRQLILSSWASNVLFLILETLPSAGLVLSLTLEPDGLGLNPDSYTLIVTSGKLISLCLMSHVSKYIKKIIVLASRGL